MENNRETPQSDFTHLTDEQFSDLLLGTTSADVKQHLEACAQCSEEADRVSGAIGSFAQQSRLWAERRAASRPLLVPHRQPALSWLHIPANPRVWTAAALAIALAVGVDVYVRKDHPRVVQQQVAEVQPVPAVSPSTLKADNELLSAIDGELRADTSTPVAMYGLTATSRSARARAPKRIAN